MCTLSLGEERVKRFGSEADLLGMIFGKENTEVKKISHQRWGESQCLDMIKNTIFT